MHNITTFCATGDIKPELSHVYVHTDTKTKIKKAVATDSYRLAEITIVDDFLAEYLQDGYYTKKQWIELCKAYNKKKRDLRAFNDTMLQVKAMQEYKDYSYPEYARIIPTSEALEAYTSGITNEYNGDYIADFLALMPTNIWKSIKFSDIKESERMMVYKNDTITLLLMALNK